MTRVLLTGASGFIANHILDILLEHGHQVRFTVRSDEKAKKLLDAHKEHADKLDYVIVKDIAQPGAFDEAVKADPPLEAVLHTASPFTFSVDDIQRDLLDPAVNGTNNILSAVHKFAPTVKRIVITSSFAAIANADLGDRPGYTYSEKDWNPVTHEQALQNTNYGYRASKTFAEKAAWDFVEKNKPNFDIATICPPMVLGPVKPYSPGIAAMNTSNTLISSIVTGQCKAGLGPAGVYCWVDVRDVALAHVRAMEKPEAGGKRFFLVEGPMSTQTIADIVAKNFPEYKDKLPEGRMANDGFPEGGVHDNDNTRSKVELGIKYTPLEKSVTDFVNSIKVFGV